MSLIMPAPTGRALYDSISLPGVLRGVPAAERPRGTMQAYYLDGDFAVPSVAYVESLFPPDFYRLLPIDVNGTHAHDARAGDVETGDMRPEHCEQWLQDFQETNPAYELGGRGELYCNRSTIAAVRAGTGRYVLGRDYYLWVATGDGSLYWEPGVNACQNVWSHLFDKSVIFDHRFMPGPGALVEPREVLTAMGQAITLALLIRSGDRVAEMIDALELDGRCRHCGYRRDHPLILHGPPCTAR